MRIGELAQSCGCAVETVRYYEKIGLLPAAGRLPNGYRVYEETHRKWLQFVLHSRALGFTQDEVRRLTAVAQQEHPSCSDVNEILIEHIGDVRHKLEKLQRMELALLRLQAKCHNGTLDECPVIDELMR